MKTIYLIRHSAPFVNYNDYDYTNVPFSEYSRNMILSVKGEEKARALCDIEDLKNIDEIYSSNSARAIGTAKYIAEMNGLGINIDNRINEREFGITYVSELPENFNIKQFEDENYKLENGESLKEVRTRFCEFLDEILENSSNKIVLSIHGILLMAYLSMICEVKFNGEEFTVKFKDKIVMSGLMKNPDVYKITFEGNEVIDVLNIN